MQVAEERISPVLPSSSHPSWVSVLLSNTIGSASCSVLLNNTTSWWAGGWESHWKYFLEGFQPTTGVFFVSFKQYDFWLFWLCLFFQATILILWIVTEYETPLIIHLEQVFVANIFAYLPDLPFGEQKDFPIRLTVGASTWPCLQLLCRWTEKKTTQNNPGCLKYKPQSSF